MQQHNQPSGAENLALTNQESQVGPTTNIASSESTANQELLPLQN